MTGRRYYLATLAAFHRHAARFAESHFVDVPPGPGAENSSAASAPLILVLVDADEAAHIALERDADCEPLPHPLAHAPVSSRVSAALAPFGVAAGDDTFAVAEKLARSNPLLRHRVL